MNKKERFDTGPVNELHPDLLGPNSLNPYHEHTSSSRGQMFTTHLGQRLVVEGATPRSIQTGTEREFGKYTFRVEMPCDGKILDIIPLYQQSVGANSINGNPETTVIFENIETKELDVLFLPEYFSMHTHFGFQYRKTSNLNKIHPGEIIPKGVVFLDSPAIKEDGDYAFGIQANVAYLTMPGVAEDGIIISKGFLKKLRFKVYERRNIQWGRDKTALNTYGTEADPRVFPDLGDPVRPDGIVAALRARDRPELAIVERSQRDMMEVNTTFDETIYAPPGGRVVDIRVNHHLQDSNIAENHSDQQVLRYDESRRRYFKKLLDAYMGYRRLRGEGLQVSGPLSDLIEKAKLVCAQAEKDRVWLTHRKKPLDHYNVDITIEYVIEPTIGFKLTDCHGGKGVVCQVMEDEHMPTDVHGVRADVVMDPNSTINRSIVGRLFEQHTNCAAAETYRGLLKILPIEDKVLQDEPIEHVIDRIESLGRDRGLMAFEYLMGYYRIASPVLADCYEDGLLATTDDARIRFVAEAIQKGYECKIVGTHRPTNQQKLSTDVALGLENSIYRPTLQPLTYVGNSGERVTTTKPARLGQMYFMLLEKIGDDGSAVSSARTQHFGVIAQLGRGDKYSKPARLQGPRGGGEAELRNFLSFCGAEWAVEMMDRNNNPETHRIAVRNLLTAENPSNIDNLIDRSKHKLGGARPMLLINHLLNVSGIKFCHKSYDPRQATSS